MRAAFIDRDGVINEDRGLVHSVQDLVFLPGAVQALRELRSAGYLLVVVTNQSGIARGLYSEADFLELTAHMQRSLLAAGVRLDAVRYCPHLPDASVERYRLDCQCRKPRPGMLTGAIEELRITPADSMLIGDRKSDIEAGRSAGVGRCYLVGNSDRPTESDGTSADGVYDNLAACVYQVVMNPRGATLAGPNSIT